MKQLTSRQVNLVKSPKELGKTKEAVSDNYSAIYENTSSALLYVKTVAELLPYFEKSLSHKKAQAICKLFGQESFNPIFEKIFPAGKEIGFPLDNKIIFDESRINMEKIIFASHLLKFSGDYLLQAFPKGEYDYLHPRIEAVVSDLKTMVETFNKNKELERQLKEYHRHVQYFEPVSPSYHDRNYDVSCQDCRISAMGETKEQALKNIEHKPECRAPKITDKNWMDGMERWYIIHPPKLLIITWEQRETLRKLEKTEAKKKN